MMNPFFPEIKARFGFGCMRFPLLEDKEIDLKQTAEMVDCFLEAGFNYFDTAHGYLNQKSETALKTCLTSRHPRERYILTDKLTAPYFNTEADIRPFFQSQLDACGVEYFDFYLMHCQNHENFPHFRACRAYETAFELKAEGKIRHVGFSFHDTAEVLDEILRTYPQVEVVQLQLNYLDWDDKAVQSRLCYEVCVKHGVPVIVMEPVKGGTLATLTDDSRAILEKLGGGSPASYALRFASDLENVTMVLSGMSDMAQMRDNISFMKEPAKLTDAERAAIAEVITVYHNTRQIPCTACRYCVDGCPQGILIPDLFACLNNKRKCNDANAAYYYEDVYTVGHGKASDCVKCGACEASCPQHLRIRDLLEEVAEVFEK